MMRKVILILAAAVVAGGAYWLITKGPGAAGTVIQLAFGDASPEGILMNGCVTVAMRQVDPPAKQITASGIDQEWVSAHLQLLDDKGKDVELQHSDGSQMIVQSQGSPDAGFFGARLRPGDRYTLRYRPDREKPKVFAVELTAPSKYQSVKLYALKPVS